MIHNDERWYYVPEAPHGLPNGCRIMKVSKIRLTWLMDGAFILLHPRQAICRVYCSNK